MKRFFTKRNVYIALFAILYLIVAFSSFWHAIEFFALTNHSWMSIILAFAFEVGQAAVLLAILTTKFLTTPVLWLFVTKVVRYKFSKF